MSSFTTALSALAAASKAVDSVSHNLANLNTTGYKVADVTFQEMIAGVEGSSGNEAGVSVASTTKRYAQGSIQPTGGALDAAIQGSGFFVVKQGSEPGSGESLYSRSGQFHVGQTGALLTASGERVQGWNINTATNSIPTSGPIEDILVPLGTTIPAQATTSFSIGANLDAAAADGTVVVVPLEIYDTQGGSHLFQLSFTKQSEDTWEIVLGTSDPMVEQPLPDFDVTTLTFENGQLSPDTEDITIGPLEFTEASGLMHWSL